ncbi:hypothetical protein [Citrobacter sp. CK198]|uniref:hypothetical protein n=1 Tax=Citrobacter sp. CK198 TaxID=2985107 RepID=UPI00336BF02A
MLGVLTGRDFYSSLFISHILAKAIPVRGAKFRKARFLAGFLLSVIGIQFFQCPARRTLIDKR